MRLLKSIHLLTLAVALTGSLGPASTALAATREWNPPGANRQWTQATNWSGGVAPVAGDTLVFRSPPGLSESTNNFPVDTSFAQLIFGQNVVPSGNRIRLTGGVLSTNGSTVNIDLPIALAAAATFEQGAPSIGSLFFMREVTLGTNTLTCHTPIDSVAGIALGDPVLSPPLVFSGSGTLRKTGPGRLTIAGVTTNFTGPVVIEGGEIVLKWAESLGVTNVPTEVRAGASLYVDSGGYSYEHVLLTGTLGCLASGGVWAGPITLTNGGGTLASRFVLCRVDGPVGGAGTLRLRNLTAGHAVTFMGSATNTFTGETILETNATASASRTAGTTVIPGDLTLEANSDFGLGASDQIADTATVTIHPGARLNVHTRLETIHRLSLNSSRAQVLGGALGVRDRVDTGTAGSSWIGLAVDSPTDGLLRLLSTTNVVFNISNAPAATDLYLGVAVTSTNSVGLWKTGPGRLVLGSSSNAISGITRVVEGELFVNGISTNEHQLGGGTLGGTGQVGRITAAAAGGILAPGVSPGLLLSSNVTLNSAVTFAVEINGTNAATDYDQLGVRGTVNLGGATLGLTNRITPPLGATFLILTNDGADAITGTFAGLTNGARLTNNLVAFAISYTAGDGNDIALIATNYVSPPVTRTWSGGGGNGNWSNPANWVGGVAPNPGDTLVFPGPGSVATNDYPASTAFGALRVTGGAWSFRGAAFTLAGGLVVSNATGAITFSNAVTFAGGGITNLAAPTLLFAGPVDAGANSLPVHADGPVDMAGTLAGQQGFLKVGAAALTLAGNNTGLLGTNRLDAGTLIVSGTTTNVTELNGGTLAGTGTVGRLTSLAGGGLVSPDSGSPGVLATRGNVAWNAATTLALQLNGTNAVTEYDQFGVRGTVNLGGAALNLTVTITPPSNTVFLILTNDSSDAITGTFAGLPESATFTNSGTVFRISYVGGTGNDVTLTSLGPPPTPAVVVRIWDGDQGLPQWSWPNNWDGNTLPSAGQALLFTGGAQTSNTNDLTAGTAYHSLRLNGNSWDLSGNAITLRSGLVLTSFTAASSVRLPLTLTTNQGFTNLPAAGFSGARLTLGGPIALDTHTLTCFATAPIEVTNQISGSGSLVKLGTNELSLNVSNSFTGSVLIREGIVYLRNLRALGGTEGATHVASNATLHIVGALNSPENVLLGGTLASSNGNGRISGTLTLSNAARFNITGTAQITVGPTDGIADVEKLGSGTLLFTGNTHSHTGAVRVAAGRLQANGTSRGTTFCTTASPTNAVLSGVGTLGNVTLTNTSGQVSITPGSTTGGPESLIISNLLNTTSNNLLVIELNGTNAVTPDFDILDVRGTVTLGGLRLQLIPGFTPPPGTRFVILLNDGTDPISGTFAGLPQDATVTVSNVTFQISYTGGTGNDVELTVVPVGFPSDFTGIAPWTNSLLRLTATGTPATAYTLIATTNLNPPVVWSPVLTNLADGGGLLEFVLPDRTNHPMRFYRLRSP